MENKIEYQTDHFAFMSRTNDKGYKTFFPAWRTGEPLIDNYGSTNRELMTIVLTERSAHVFYVESRAMKHYADIIAQGQAAEVWLLHPSVGFNRIK